MKMPFPFEPLLIFGFMAGALLLGVVLRARVSFFQNFLIPSCLLGGLAGLILISTGVISADTEMLETYAYHLFNLSFISVGLTSRGDEVQSIARSNDMLKGSLWMALIQAFIFPLQAIIGGGLVLILSGMGIELFRTFGFLVPLGFVQGPGQALSIGKVWEAAGFEYGATIGLTFAAIGFLFAFFVGVPMVNRGIRKGKCVHTPSELSTNILKGYNHREGPREPAGNLVMHTGNIDSMAFQMALIGFIYLIAYFLVKGIGSLLPPQLGTTLWGFLFFIGLALALLFRWIVKIIGIGYMVDPGIQKRITGLTVDFMIVATIMAVQVVIVWKFIVPIAFISMISGIITTVTVMLFGNRLKTFSLERTAAIYGTVTGTVSTGLLLLRIADPDFRTGVALELGFMIMFVSPVILVCMLLVSAPVVWNWSIGFTMIIFTAMMAAAFILLFILSGRKAVKE